jgi:hypothetical protein
MFGHVHGSRKIAAELLRGASVKRRTRGRRNPRDPKTAFSVMAGLVPAIHAAPLPANPKVFRRLDYVDDRDKPGHDGVGFLS